MSAKLGEILIRENLITSQQLREALDYQRTSGGRLGSNLIKLGIISDEVITSVLSGQYGVPSINLDLFEIEQETVHLISQEVASKYSVMPISKVGATLTMAMADPTNVFAMDDIKFMTGLNVEPVVASEASIQSAIVNYYGASKEIDILNNGYQGELDEISAKLSKNKNGNSKRYILIINSISLLNLLKTNTKMNILVTGGAGYIGSVVAEELVTDGHTVNVYDNLSKGHRDAVAAEAAFIEGDLLETEKLAEVLKQNKIEAVIHMAASSLVGESVEEPAKYYKNNVVAGLSLLDAMLVADVKKIVFSSTAAVYGEPAKQPIVETDPTNPTNPYGETKLAFENILKWYEKVYKLRFVALRYFNAAGASEKCGERHDPETHLIPIILQAASGKREFIEVYGTDYPTADGTCVRDYIHVEDLARVHIMALDILDERSEIYNLGCGGAGYSVKEVIDEARLVTNREIKVKFGERRAGDPAVLIASSDKIKRELGWKPEKQDLQKIIASAWTFFQKSSF